MQAINRQLINLITIIFGLVVKYVTIKPLVIMFETNGVILSSVITYLVMIIINLVVINAEVRLRMIEFVKKFTILVCSCFIMFIAVAAVYEAIISNFVLEAKLSSMILIVICAVLGTIIYFYSIVNMGFVEYLFGRKITLKNLKSLRRKI